MKPSAPYLILLALIFAPMASAAGEKITPVFTSESEALTKLRPLAQFSKDQFESSADFVKRVCPAVEKALNAKSGTQVHFAVLFGTGVDGNYDPDKKAFIFDVWGDSNYEKTYSEVTVVYFSKDKGAYTGQNAFGVTKAIEVKEVDEVILRLPIHQRGINAISTKLLSKPEEARKLEKDLQVIISTKILPPCFIDERSNVSPKIDSPYEIKVHKLKLVGSRNSSWKIIKKSTGEILKTGDF